MGVKFLGPYNGMRFKPKKSHFRSTLSGLVFGMRGSWFACWGIGQEDPTSLGAVLRQRDERENRDEAERMRQARKSAVRSAGKTHKKRWKYENLEQ